MFLGKTIIHIHIPKTGGMSMQNSFKNLKRHEKSFDYVFKHWDCNQYIQAQGQDFFNSGYKITVIRHPLDRLVSTFFFLGGIGPFSEYVEKLYKDKDDFNHPDKQLAQGYLRPQWWWITIDGSIAVDKILRFNDYNNEWNNLMEENMLYMGHSKLSHINKTSHKYYMEYYTDRTHRMAEELYAIDFENLSDYF